MHTYKDRRKAPGRKGGCCSNAEKEQGGQNKKGGAQLCTKPKGANIMRR